ncbi:MAG: biotin/lipoate A/B protein ligase family protein [Acidithiobacillus sp.]
MLLRLIRQGVLQPELLHQTYMGLAEAQRDGDLPILLLVQSQPHLSLGAAQSGSAELDPIACANQQIPVLQRPLGGGLVWVDEGQLNYFFIFPRSSGIRQAPELFTRISSWVVALHDHFGLPVEARNGHDFWCQGYKVGGTGAASIGNSLVLGGSFMLRTQWDVFIRCVRAPSEGFRQWLAEALEESLRSWSDLRGGQEFSADEVVAACPSTLERCGFLLQDGQGTISPAEQNAIAHAELESPDWESVSRRRVSGGIKLKAGSFLTEKCWPDGQCLRVWTENNRFRKVFCSAWRATSGHSCDGMQPDSAEFHEFLQTWAGVAAPLWSQRFAETAVWRD